MSFYHRLSAAWTERRTLLCVGLDPRPKAGREDPRGAVREILAENRRLVDATAEFAACYKPNIAFYEAWGSAGWDALKATIDYIPDGIPVLLDAKRGDIDSTARAYARAVFEELGADAVTVSPYLGRDAADPFLEYPEAGVFFLCRTSNPRAGIFQDLNVGGSASGDAVRAEQDRATGTVNAFAEPLYLRVARECVSWSDRAGLVVAGNDTAALRKVRSVVPDAWFLAPGIGAQGGDLLEAWRAGAREDGLGVIPAVSRAVSEAPDPGAAAAALRRASIEAWERILEERAGGPGRGIAALRGTELEAGTELDRFGRTIKEKLLRGLVETGCFRVGDFTLKSGIRSPFYIDLRSVVSDPGLLETAAEAYALLARNLSYDRLGGIPAAALPLATAAALRLKKPLVWPRMPAKEHGTGNRVEGRFRRGDRIFLLDDLITTGSSKLEAVEILRCEGLEVEDLGVLIERGVRGRRDMEAAGIRLHAFLHVRELIALCVSSGLVDPEAGRRMEEFVETE